MIKNYATGAPEIIASGLYEKWKETNIGSLRDFFAFMTTPSAARYRFLQRYATAETTVNQVCRASQTIWKKGGVA